MPIAIIMFLSVSSKNCGGGPENDGVPNDLVHAAKANRVAPTAVAYTTGVEAVRMDAAVDRLPTLATPLEKSP